MRTCLIAILALFWMVSLSGAEPIIKVVYMDKESPPRILGDGASIDWAKPGITLELFKMVEKQVGVQFQFKRMPWKRCLYVVENGLADATFHASYSSDRAKFGVYPLREGEPDSTRAIYKNAYVIYVKKGSGVTWEGKTLKNISRPIGTQLSYAIAGDLRKMGYQVEEEGSVTSNLDKLLAGRISAYADLENIVDSALADYGSKYAAVEKLQPALSEKVYYLLFSKKFAGRHPQLTDQIWDAIRDIQQTDLYRNMLKKYEK